MFFFGARNIYTTKSTTAPMVSWITVGVNAMVTVVIQINGITKGRDLVLRCATWVLVLDMYGQKRLEKLDRFPYAR